MQQDILVNLRRELHRNPELSNEEKNTAARVAAFMKPLRPDQSIYNLGGTGVAFVFHGIRPGPTVLLRSELDALPIQEANTFTHRSNRSGVAHLCGHDGHMTVLAQVALTLSEKRPPRGSVVLLYQPAEETGAGAAQVLADPRFAGLQPDYTFALHNLPGYPIGQVVVRKGTMTCASRGVEIRLIGTPAHAAHPESGVSPASAMCDLIADLQALGGNANTDELAFATVVGARLGARAFGTAPQKAEIWTTVRSETNQTMEDLILKIESQVEARAGQHNLKFRIDYADVFPATANSDVTVDLIARAVSNPPICYPEHPFRWSEDFGHFTEQVSGALFGLGAGVHHAQLHDESYDFPEELVPIGAEVFMKILRQVWQLGNQSL